MSQCQSRPIHPHRHNCYTFKHFVCLICKSTLLYIETSVKHLAVVVDLHFEYSFCECNGGVFLHTIFMCLVFKLSTHTVRIIFWLCCSLVEKQSSISHPQKKKIVYINIKFAVCLHKQISKSSLCKVLLRTTWVLSLHNDLYCFTVLSICLMVFILTCQHKDVHSYIHSYTNVNEQNIVFILCSPYKIVLWFFIIVVNVVISIFCDKWNQVKTL